MTREITDRHIPVLDGWRMLMLFMISWYHIWQQSWLAPTLRLGQMTVSFDPYVRAGYLMVDGILLLSAFLLFLPYARHMLSGDALPSIRDFYIKRAARIVPSYYVYLILVLLLIALPDKRYGSVGAAALDLFRHATFTHTFFRESYMLSPIGFASWTLGIEVQAYLLFPFIARAAVKKPYIVLPFMVCAGVFFRGLVMSHMDSYSMVVNQLPAFLDVYAIGMAFAMAYVFLCKRVNTRIWAQVLFSILSIALFVLLLMLFRDQARTSGQGNIHIGQMVRRMPLALVFGGLFVSTALGLRPLRFILGNRLTKVLAGITLNYYLWHAVICQLLKRWHIPPYTDQAPNIAGEMPWQWQYTYLCFMASALLAAVLTYLIERPCIKAIQKLFILKETKLNERC